MNASEQPVKNSHKREGPNNMVSVSSVFGHYCGSIKSEARSGVKSPSNGWWGESERTKLQMSQRLMAHWHTLLSLQEASCDDFLPPLFPLLCLKPRNYCNSYTPNPTTVCKSHFYFSHALITQPLPLYAWAEVGKQIYSCGGVKLL